MSNAFLQGQRVYLRPIEPSDAPIVAACNNDPLVRQTFFTHTPESLTACRERLVALYRPGNDYFPLLICRTGSDEPVGVTAFHRMDLISRAAVFSLCIPILEARGLGYGREATRLMLAYGFDVLNLHRIQLHVWAENEAAIALYRRCGFREEGRLREAMKHQGVWCDFLLMGLLEGEYRAEISGA